MKCPQGKCFAPQALSVEFVLDGIAFRISHPDNIIDYLQKLVYIKHIRIQVPTIQRIVNGGQLTGGHTAVSVGKLIVNGIVGGSIGKGILPH